MSSDPATIITMQKPTSDWEEGDVLALPPGENDRFERKGAQLLDLTIPNVKVDAVLNELAKQLSAFANMGGGLIIYGVTDAGAVSNGGIARVIRGNRSTKEWLEDVIPTLTDYEITGFSVYEIKPNSSDSAIGPDKSLYVVDVPDSDRAPHQSKRDNLYYVRLASKSQPAPHRLIEDIRNRARHPKIEICEPRILSASYVPQPGTMDSLQVVLRVGVRNSGKVLAEHTALLFGGNISLSLTQYTFPDHHTRPSALPGTGIVELSEPLYPEMSAPVSTTLTMGAFLPEGSLRSPGILQFGDLQEENVILSITAFADSAPRSKHEFGLRSIDPDSILGSMKQREAMRRPSR
jgi:hypothetical protein